MHNPPRLIINADDLGFSPGVTDGILEAHKRGVLSSATLMTTMPDRDRALDLAAQAGTGAAGQPLGVGIHLSLTQGTPLTSCRRILTRDGHFIRSLPKLFLRLRTKAARQEAQYELIAQIQYAQSRGLVPTHVDSHKHVCHFPPLHAPLIAACNATGIQWLRTTRERPTPGIPKLPFAYRVLAHFAQLLAKKAQAAGLHTPDRFLGLSTTGKTTSAHILAFLQMPATPGTLTEYMLHPGYASDITPGETRLLASRELELRTLTDPSVVAAVQGGTIQLVHFGSSA